MVSKGQIVGFDWNRIARLYSHVLAHMNSLTASRCHIKASNMNSLTASRRHIKAYRLYNNVYTIHAVIFRLSHASSHYRDFILDCNLRNWKW